MARVTRTSDIIAICIILSNYKLDIPIGQVIENVELFEESHKRFFGTGIEDMRNAFYMFAYNLWQVGHEDLEKIPEMIKAVSLAEWIRPILLYREVYFNDEGEYWIGDYELGDTMDDCDDNWYDDYENTADINYEFEIRKFFNSPQNYNSMKVMEFFNSHGIKDSILEINSSSSQPA